ncbi:MAG TPA: hypothetical protein VFH26_10405 [Gemmatimonadales bacterium]|nr:hypothetical protein [Gemmatimonadales bacterium]
MRESCAAAAVVFSAGMRGSAAVISAAAILLGCATALMFGGGAELSAQQVRLRPDASLYLPSRVSLQNGGLHVRQKIGVTVGARLTVTFSPRFDIVSGVTYLPGYATFRGAGKRLEVATSSHLLTGTTGARYWLLPRSGKLAWEAHTILGAVFGGQPAYEDLFESSMLSGILGSTVHLRVGRIVSFKLGIQERLYRVGFGGRERNSSKPPLRISFGMGLPLLESVRSARKPPAETRSISELVRKQPEVTAEKGLLELLRRN